MRLTCMRRAPRCTTTNLVTPSCKRRKATLILASPYLSWNDHIQQITTTSREPFLCHEKPIPVPVGYQSVCLQSLSSTTGWIFRKCLGSPGAVTKMLRDLEWESLADRRQTSRLVILYKALNGHLSLPIGNLAQPINITSRHTNSKGFKQMKAVKDVYKYSFLPRTIIDWNLLPDSIVSLQTTNQFKNATKKHTQASNQD